MHELIVDGKFLAQRITGVQRFSREVLRELSLFDNLKITVAMPENATVPEGDFPNCEFVKVGRLKGNLWEQFSLPRFCKKKKLPLLCMGNIAPISYKSYVVIHDVTFKEKSIPNSKLWSLKYSFLVKRFIYKTKAIFTDSEFTKSRIKHFYKKLKSEPIVVYLGNEHINRLETECMKGLPENYYLSVGSVNPNKNFKYVLHLAKNNPNVNFVIAGSLNSSFEEFIRENGISNCFFTGYVSNEQLVWLYQNCNGFILSSLYEGFGMPPLEAVAAGCRKLYLSDIPVFREIYEGCATFFNPNDYENTVDLQNGIVFEESNFKKLLEKYSWKNAADIIYRGIFEQ